MIKWKCFCLCLIFIYFGLALQIGLLIGHSYNIIDDQITDSQRQRLKRLCEKEVKMALQFDYCCKSCWHTWVSTHRAYVCPKCGSKNLDVGYYKTDD